MADGIRLEIEVGSDGEAKIKKIDGSLKGLGDQAEKQKGRWRTAWHQMGQATDAVQEKVRRIATGIPAMIGAAGMVGALGMGVRAGFRFNSTLETMQARFEQVTRNADQAKRMVQEISQIDLETVGLDIKEIGEAALVLAASKMDAGRWLRILADAAAAANVSVLEMARNLVKINEGGRAGMALLSFAQAGLVTKKMLHEVGVAFDEETMQLKSSGRETIAALETILVQRFGGQQKRMANTWAGVVDDVQDYSDRILAALARPMFEGVVKGMRDVLDLSGDLSESDQVKKWADSIRDAFEKMTTAIRDAVKWVQDHRKAIDIVGGVTLQYAAILGGLVLAVSAVNKVVAAGKVIMAAHPILRIATIVALAIPWINAGAKALGGWGAVFEYVGAAIQTAGGFLEWVGKGAMGTFGAVWHFLQAMIDSLLTGFAELGTAAVKALTFQFHDAGQAMANFKASAREGWAGMTAAVQEATGAWRWDGFAAETKARFADIGKDSGTALAKAAAEAATAAPAISPWENGEDSGGPTGTATPAKEPPEYNYPAADVYDYIKDLNEEAQQTYMETRTAAERYNIEVERLGFVAKVTGMDADTLARAMKRLGDELDATEAERFVAHYEKLWGGFFGELANVIQYGMGDAFAAMFDTSKDLDEALTEIWQGMKMSFIKATADMAAAWIVGKAKMLLAHKTFEAGATAATVSGSVARTAAQSVETGSTAVNTSADVAGASAKIMKAHAWMPFVGVAIAAALIATMLAVLASAKPHRAGGAVYAFGSGSEDNVPAFLGAREYVMPRAATDRYGMGFMDSIRLGTFEGGGMSVSISVDARGATTDAGALGAEIERRIVPAIERLYRQRRLRFAGGVA